MKQYLITLLCLVVGIPLTTLAQCTNDVTPPTALCRSITLNLDNVGIATLTAVAIDSGSFDNCGVASYWINGSASVNFSCVDLGTNAVVLTVIDSAGNADSCTAMVQVEDNIAPVARCQSTLTYYLGNTGQVVLTPPDLDNGSTDNCAITNLFLNGQLNQVILTNSNLGANSVQLNVVDASNIHGLCQTTVMLLDTLIPTITCQNDTVYLDVNGQVTVFPNQVGTSSDVGGISQVLINGQSSLTFSAADVGNNPVTYVAIDQAGNTNACVALVTVLDSFNTNNSIPLVEAQALGVKVYPNPASSTLTVELEQSSLEQVEIRSLTGQVLLQENGAGKNNIQLSVEQFPPGLYLVLITTPQGKICQKIGLK